LKKKNNCKYRYDVEDFQFELVNPEFEQVYILNQIFIDFFLYLKGVPDTIFKLIFKEYYKKTCTKIQSCTKFKVVRKYF
jgi:hypothetical protein